MSLSSGYILGSDPFSVSTTQEHALGTRATFQVKDSSGQSASLEALYCKAEATLTAGQVCELPLLRGTDAYEVDTALQTTNAASIADAAEEKFAACVPLTGFVSGEYGWFAVKGLIPVSLAANCAAQKLLYLTATAGVVDDTDTNYLVEGLLPVAAITTATVADCIAFNDLIIKRETP